MKCGCFCFLKIVLILTGSCFFFSAYDGFGKKVTEGVIREDFKSSVNYQAQKTLNSGLNTGADIFVQSERMGGINKTALAGSTRDNEEKRNWSFRLAGSKKRVRSREASKEFRYGSLLFSQGRLEEALIHLEKAAKLDTSLVRARLLKAKSLFYLEKEDEALSELIPLVEKHPDFGEAVLWTGKVLFFKGEFERAEKYLSRYLEFNSGSPETYYLLGEVERIIGKNINAMENYTIVEDWLDVIGMARIRKAELYLEQGEYERAIEHLNFVIGNKMYLSIEVVEEAIKLLRKINPAR